MTDQFPARGAPSPVSPWHMWGATETMVILNQGGFASHQLARVSYRRPDTWRFFFAVRVIDAPTVGAGVAPLITVAFDLFLGVGRSVVEVRDGFAAITGFANFNIGWAIAAAPPIGRLKWTTVVTTPPMIDVPAAANAQVISEIPAQDIQCAARAGFAGGAGPLQATIEVTAFFAPNVHVRPDWMRDGVDAEVFLGSETGGT